MKKLLIVGSGGHGKVLAETAADTNLWDDIAFLDDRYPDCASVLKWKVIGRIDDAHKFLDVFPSLVVGIGNNQLRVNLLKKFQQAGFAIPSIIHPRAFVSSSAILEEGVVVFAQVAINSQALIGLGGIINTGATVDHDCVLAKGVHVCPGSHLAGEVTVGEYSWIGIGASIIQCLEIGSNVMIGAGSVVVNNIPNDVTVVGVPGRVTKQHAI